MGILSAIDPDAGDTLTYQISGGVDSTSFYLNGNTLKTLFIANYSTKSSYAIVLNAKDSNNLSSQSPLSLTINVNPPSTPGLTLSLSDVSDISARTFDSTLTISVTCTGSADHFLVSGDVKVDQNIFCISGQATNLTLEAPSGSALPITDYYGRKQIFITANDQTTFANPLSLTLYFARPVYQLIALTQANFVSELSGVNAADPDSFFYLTESIDLSGYANWTPIQGQNDATCSIGFAAVLEGNGFTISGLSISGASPSNQGLFCTVSGTLSGLSLNAVSINLPGSGSSVGALTGSLLGNGVIRRSQASGTISAANWSDVGGLVGSMPQSNGVITQSKNSVTVSGNTNIGGLVGHAESAPSGSQVLLSENYSVATAITASNNNAGGIAGRLVSGILENSYSTSAITSSYKPGGLVGEMSGLSSLVNSYATGAVHANTSYAGGLVGYINEVRSSFAIFQSFSLNTVTGPASPPPILGGLFGLILSGSQGCDVSDCASSSYWKYSLSFECGNQEANLSNCGADTGIVSSLSTLNADANGTLNHSVYNSPTAWDLSKIWQSAPSSLPTLRNAPP